jgi:outer membrane protein OmpA-like peptidoglycan-associated protein
MTTSIKPSRVVVALLVAAVAGLPLAASQERRPPANRRNFLACPIVRDTAVLPCWLAEYEGELYYLGTQGSSGSAFYPPQLLHDVLVEAEVGEGPRVCGGLPLKNVEVSVVPEINRACNTVLPAEPQYSAPPSPPAPVPNFPVTTREFSVPYDFDSDYITLHTSRIILEAARIAKAAKARRIEISGGRASTLLSDGRVITERATLGEVRASKMRDALVGLGIPAATIDLTWQGQPDAPDGVSDASRRRTVIRLRE